MRRLSVILKEVLIVLAAGAASTVMAEAPIWRAEADWGQVQPNSPPPAPRAAEESKPKDDQQRTAKDRATDEHVEGGKWVVVVSKDNPVQSLKLDELRRIFLRETSQWADGKAITVYERPTESPICERFAKEVLKRSRGELKEYWMNLELTRGMKPPKVLRTPALVKEYLQRVQGGVSYLYVTELDDSVKRVHIVDRPDDPK